MQLTLYSYATSVSNKVLDESAFLKFLIKIYIKKQICIIETITISAYMTIIVA